MAPPTDMPHKQKKRKRAAYGAQNDVRKQVMGNDDNATQTHEAARASSQGSDGSSSDAPHEQIMLSDDPIVVEIAEKEPGKSAQDHSSQQHTEVAGNQEPRPSRPKRTQDDDSATYTGALYKSSMFKLQIDQMLSEVCPNYEKHFSGVDDALRRLKGTIEGIDSHDNLSISEAAQFLHKKYKLTAPFPSPKPDKTAAYKLAYARPSKINVVGSYALKTMVNGDSVLSIDMVVVMPSSIFQEKDYLNYRYFYKKAHYLACIAGELQLLLNSEYSLSYNYLNGNSLQPQLVLQNRPSVNQPGKDFEIHIIPAAPPGFFAESKLRPYRNSIRSKDRGDDALVDPTPFYNASLQSDSNFEHYLRVLVSTSKNSTSYKDACVLGRIWLRQRGFGSSLAAGGFGHFEWAVVTALLLRGGGPKGHAVLSPGYSSYQMFKAVVQFLSVNDLSAKPFIYNASDFKTPKTDSPIMYDGSCGASLLYKMTPWSYSSLRQEATASLAMLNDPMSDQFESTFIILTSQPLQRYDCLLKIAAPAIDMELSADHYPKTLQIGKHVFQVLREGLGDRVKHLDIKSLGTSSWLIKSAASSAVDETLFVCVNFDPANIDRLVDHGPPAEDKKKAAKYQKFWGDKAELRRFKDGSIVETLVWSPGTSYSLFKQIVTCLMMRHFGKEVVNSLSFFGEDFEKLLPGHGRTDLKPFDPLAQAFNTFERDIGGLESLPLQLKQLSAVGPQLRRSSLRLPTFGQNRHLETPADVVIQFEGSGRWPDDIIAIQRTKIAFLLRIGELLRESRQGITARLGLENENQIFQNCAFLDVFYESGAAFRLRIRNDREQTLLERLIKDSTTDGRAREEAVQALSTFKSNFIQLPLHTQSISTHCTRFPLLSPTIRLVKLWFNRHMLSRYVSEELIELLVIRTFLQPYPWTTPSSVMAGFLRTLLFISRWNWRLVPLIVDFSGSMTDAEVSAINTRIEAWRKIDPAMNRTVLFAASNHDVTGTAFTDKGPSKMVAARMTALAKSACKLVKEKGFELDHRSLFAASTADYDFVIHLSPKFVADKRIKGDKIQRFKNLEIQSEEDLSSVNYSPVQLFLNELEKLYTNTIVFFYDGEANSVIAGLWNPQTTEARSFKVNMVYATKLKGGPEGDKILIDKQAILSEVARVGGDMVSRVELNR